MNTLPIEQKKSRPRKDHQQKCSHPIEQNKSRPRKDDQQNALTYYRTKEIKAKNGLPADMHSPTI